MKSRGWIAVGVLAASLSGPAGASTLDDVGFASRLRTESATLRLHGTGLLRVGFFLAAAGYAVLGVAPSLMLACAAVVLAHAGGSTVWVFSTTLLQAQTEDRFRGRVFSAEYAFSMLSMSTVSYLAGVFVDLGVSARTVALG